MYKTIDEVRHERRRLEKRVSKQEKHIKSLYKDFKRSPFGDSKIYTFVKTAANLGHLVSFLSKFRRKR